MSQFGRSMPGERAGAPDVSLEPLRSALAGRYRVERELGAGGMATVFLAEDLRHHRRVAVKVLHAELSAVLGPERFLKEIELTASLQHPHILPLFDSGDAGGLLYYVMPYVDGETLRSRLARERQLPIHDSLLIAREIADALGYAHRHGIVHRDIKPENVLLHDGHALVADFGIALAVQSAGGDRMTGTGISLGTPQYMSPEQAMGERVIDARSDIYSLGVVAYEMLVGEPPFRGPTAQAVVARTLTEHPAAPSTMRDTVPPSAERAVLRALARLPADRFASAGDFAAALQAAPSPSRIPDYRTRVRRRTLLAALATGLAAVAAAYWLGRANGLGDAASLGGFGIARQVTWEPGLEVSPALSPDGKLVAYEATDGVRSRIFVRPVDGGRPVPLSDDSAGVERDPEWSRDGSRILFLRDGVVFSAPAGGGAPKQEVPRRGGDVESATWSPDRRRIAYAVDDSIFVREATGAIRYVTRIFQPSLCTWGNAGLIACMAGNRWYLKPGMAFGNLAPSWIVVVDPSNGRVTSVTDSTATNAAPRWSPDGHTLFYVSNRLGVPDVFSVRPGRRGDVDTPARRLTVGLGVNTFSLSASGSRLAYSVLTTTSSVWQQPWSEQGTRADAVSPAKPAMHATQVTFGQEMLESFGISRDGQWLYYDSNLSGNPDLYRMRLPNGEPERLTTETSPEFNPDPSPDGRTIAFHSWRTGSRDIFVMPLDGGPIEQVTQSPEQEQYARWSPDGRMLAFASQSQPLGIFISRRDAGGHWRVRKRLADGHWADWSPDARYLSYVDALTGGALYVMAADSGAPRALYDASLPGMPLAETSHWSPDGRTIYFKGHDPDGRVSIWSVPAAGGLPHRVVDVGDSRMRSDRYGFQLSHGRLYYVLFNRQSNVWVMDLTPR